MECTGVGGVRVVAFSNHRVGAQPSARYGSPIGDTTRVFSRREGAHRVRASRVGAFCQRRVARNGRAAMTMTITMRMKSTRVGGGAHCSQHTAHSVGRRAGERPAAGVGREGGCLLRRGWEVLTAPSSGRAGTLAPLLSFENLEFGTGDRLWSSLRPGRAESIGRPVSESTVGYRGVSGCANSTGSKLRSGGGVAR